MMGNYERTDPNLAQTECAFLSTLKQNKSNGRYRFFIRRLIFTEKKTRTTVEKKAEQKRKKATEKERGTSGENVCLLFIQY